MAKRNKIGLLGLSNTTLLLIGGGVALYFLTRKKTEPVQGIGAVNIKFKNVGAYLDEQSSRYEAIIDNRFKVRVYKPYNYEGSQRGFKFGFYTLDNYSLDDVNDDINSTWWINATKKETYERIYEMLNNKEDYNYILKEVIEKEKFIERVSKY